MAPTLDPHLSSHTGTPAQCLGAVESERALMGLGKGKNLELGCKDGEQRSQISTSSGRLQICTYWKGCPETRSRVVKGKESRKGRSVME